MILRTIGHTSHCRHLALPSNSSDGRTGGSVHGGRASGTNWQVGSRARRGSLKRAAHPLFSDGRVARPAPRNGPPQIEGRLPLIALAPPPPEPIPTPPDRPHVLTLGNPPT